MESDIYVRVRAHTLTVICLVGQIELLLSTKFLIKVIIHSFKAGTTWSRWKSCWVFHLQRHIRCLSSERRKVVDVTKGEGYWLNATSKSWSAWYSTGWQMYSF